jgi:Fe-S cluster assembly scaffold protein SufB
MEMVKLNETPVRTSRNFNINNIKLENINIPEKVKKFGSVKIYNESEENKIDFVIDDFEITYGISEEFLNLAKQNSNYNTKIIINSKKNKNIKLDFLFDEENANLIDNIEIVAKEGSKATIYLKYEAKNDVEVFHNEVIKIFAKKNSNIKVIFVNLTNYKTNNFISIDSNIEDNAKLDYTIIDFGGKNSITNLYSNLIGEESDQNINTIYLGREEQVIDLNYIGELRGEKSNINIEVQGALKDNSRKHFKGTIDFKKGCKKATGNENEYCTILSDTAKSLALPMLLCSEEDVEGNHSSAAGKIGEKELFYIMSRGFEIKEAMKLLVRAKFNTIIETISDEELKSQILEEIDKRLD